MRTFDTYGERYDGNGDMMLKSDHLAALAEKDERADDIAEKTVKAFERYEKQIAALQEHYDVYKAISIALQKMLRDKEARIKKLEARLPWSDGFNKGRESVLRRNESGCCCLFNEDEEIVSVCAAHKEREEALHAEANINMQEICRLRGQVAKVREGMEQLADNKGDAYWTKEEVIKIAKAALEGG